MVCFGKLLYGSCTKADCKYAHNESIVSRTRKRYIEMMTKQQKVSKQSGNAYKSAQPLKFSNVDTESVHPNLSNLCLDLDQVREELFLANISDPRQLLRAVHRAGVIRTDLGDVPVSSSLFDTGAVSASSKDFVDKHREQLEPYIENVRATVTLAAQNAVFHISEVASLPVMFLDSKSAEHVARIRFYVLPESNNVIVIGLPAIIVHLGVLFMDMLQSAIDEYAGPQSHEISSIDEEDLRFPWSVPLDSPAPEDDLVPLPCYFPEPLHYMEMTPEEAREEMFGMIDEHVSLCAKSFGSANPYL